MDYNLDILRERLRTRREELGLKQQDVGEKLNISFNQVSRHELGKAVPTLELLLKYCNIYECELGYLLGEEEYLSGTKLDTAIERKTGLTPSTTTRLDNMLRMRVFSFIGSGKRETRVLNDLLSHPKFEALLQRMTELDESYEIYRDHKITELQGIDKPVLDAAMDAYTGPIDYLNDPDAPELSKEIIDTIAMIDKQIDENYLNYREYEHSAKIARYDLSEAFRELINVMYPIE